ncbi:hypothetical protein [Clostridium sp.]|uniref:hypothetical protein n=1 Tax=Clostridium sp. TaxID=1506 RepID=UPI003F40A6CD
MKDDCSRKSLLIKELIHDWDELNIAFKSLIIVATLLFIVIVLIAFFSDGGSGINNSLEVVFRTTLASVFGFLLSSNIKANNKKKRDEIEKIKQELKKVQEELDDIQVDAQKDKDCILEQAYTYRDVNIVQISIALSFCIISIFILSSLLITNNLENVPAVSQIRDLMCSSVGFLIGESGKK